MSKRIEDIEHIIMNEAKNQVLLNGYSGMTIRSVSKACGIAVGTVYNYFASKELLTASFMLEDWKKSLALMKAGCDKSAEPSESLKCIYDALCSYSNIYKSALFDDSDAEKIFATAFGSRHIQLRSQIAALIKALCDEKGAVKSELLADFVAGNILSWTLEGESFENINNILRLLFK